MKSPVKVEFSIVIPCLNEIRTLPTCIARAQAFLKAQKIKGEIVVGDNGSTDGSQAAAKKLGARVIDIPRRGYGAALYGAIKASRGKYIIMGDADDSYHFDELQPFIEPLRSGLDLVMGDRFKGGIEPGAMPWKNRYIGNPILSWLGRVLFSNKVRDFHCGMRGFSRSAFENMDLRTTGMEFASEIVIKANLLRMKISEVPVKLYKDGRDRPPHLRPWRDGWRHLRFMMLYSPRWLFFYPGAALMALGTFLMVYLLPGIRPVGRINLDIHTLLYASGMVILGFQAVLYAYLAKVFGVREKLLRSNQHVEKLQRWFSLEAGVILGAVMLVTGLGISVWEISNWGAQGFGALEPLVSLRPAILAVTLLVLGFETILFSFFASWQNVSVRPEET